MVIFYSYQKHLISTYRCTIKIFKRHMQVLLHSLNLGGGWGGDVGADYRNLIRFLTGGGLRIPAACNPKTAIRRYVPPFVVTLWAEHHPGDWAQLQLPL